MKKSTHRARGSPKWAMACLLPLLLGACAGLPRDAALPINDPNEDMNRRVMAANQEVLRPASEFVRTAIPGPVRDRLRDLNTNLKQPRVFVNNVLQARFDAATHTGARFVMNTLFGLGGFVDVASHAGVPQESGDFGQTLFVWGVADGPYVVRPYLGPATLRDSVGSTVDMVADPVGWAIGSQVALSVSTSLLDAAERLGQLKQAEDASIDFYSFVRSAYYQTRRAELREAIGQPTVIASPALDDPDAPGRTATANAQSPPAMIKSTKAGAAAARRAATARDGSAPAGTGRAGDT